MKISITSYARSENIDIIHLWKVQEALHKPNGILLKAKVPNGHVKVVFSRSLGAIEIWLYPEYPSRKQKRGCPAKMLSFYNIKRIWAESPKCSRWKSKEKAQLTVLCRDLKLMSRHELVLIAHDQSRPLLLSVPSVLMSRRQLHVATSLSSYSSSFYVATSVLGCDHFAGCKTTSCCDFYCHNSIGGFLIF